MSDPGDAGAADAPERALPDADTLRREPQGCLVAEAVDRVAHQLKNPLQAITVNLEVIRLRAGGTDVAPEVERLGAIVDENVRLLDRRIRMLVALTRRSPDEGWTAVDARAFFRDAVTAFRLDERERGRGFEVEGLDAGDEGPRIRVRAGALLTLLVVVAGHLRGGAEARPRLSVRPDGEALLVEARGPLGLEGGEAALEEQARWAGARDVQVEAGRLALRFVTDGGG